MTAVRVTAYIIAIILALWLFRALAFALTTPT